MVNLKNVLITLTLCFCSFAISQDVTFTVYDDGKITYTSDYSISGYQFDHTGCALGAADASSAEIIKSADSAVS